MPCKRAFSRYCAYSCPGSSKRCELVAEASGSWTATGERTIHRSVPLSEVLAVSELVARNRFDYEPCSSCGRRIYGRKCKRRTCSSHVGLWLQDQRRVFKAAIASWPGLSTMVTVTAPGQDVLPYDPALCTHPPGEKCAGKAKGCRVYEHLAVDFNATVLARLGVLENGARQYAARRFGRGRLPVTLGYVTQEQARGVWHVHIAIGYYAGQEGALECYVRALQRGLLRNGFGPQFDRGKRSQDPGALARYLSRYLDPGRYSEAFIRTLKGVEAHGRQNPFGRTVQRPVYVSPSLTRRTGRTLAFEAFKRRDWRQHGNRPLQEVFVAYVNHCGELAERQSRLPVLESRHPPWQKLPVHGRARGPGQRPVSAVAGPINEDSHMNREDVIAWEVRTFGRSTVSTGTATVAMPAASEVG